jgi:hypothetical protein
MEKSRINFYPLVLDDGGRNYSRRPYQINDCSVRAFAILSGLPYDEIYDILRKAGRKSNEGFWSDRWIERKKGKVLNGKFKRVSLKRGKITPMNFSKFYPRGRYLLESHNHTWVVIDGVHRDMWRVKDQNEPLFGIWKFTPNPFKFSLEYSKIEAKSKN